MVGDKGRPVRPRSARTETGMHINGKLESSHPATRTQALYYEGELLRKGSLQPQPGCHDLHPAPLHESRPAWSSMPRGSGACRTAPGTASLSESCGQVLPIP